MLFAEVVFVVRRALKFQVPSSKFQPSVAGVNNSNLKPRSSLASEIYLELVLLSHPVNNLGQCLGGMKYFSV